MGDSINSAEESWYRKKDIVSLMLCSKTKKNNNLVNDLLGKLKHHEV